MEKQTEKKDISARDTTALIEREIDKHAHTHRNIVTTTQTTTTAHNSQRKLTIYMYNLSSNRKLSMHTHIYCYTIDS